ncbi:histidine phosphatase family protein [Streptococcus cuniculi]|uniref:Histidine phosphatase family protein n=1 Tax=Streptococcus cuniculi TaxID=1432788 RepID=A0A4Y9JCF4_9STRE|nr:histidine phosphatase family protein [Streptococcus cuniculi]MBF0777623.1 histidine phosphatase family protein [Streptococcus cuniculi]TFU98663.1 histidine phosphatase family protein [Streptococcus cuniculi]
MKIFLMRHGETDYNKARCFYGSVDVPINAHGKQQALQLRDIMADKNVSQIYTSSLQRTKETARLVFDTDSVALSSLDEKGFGKWEGLTADEIEQHYPNEWQAWLEAPFEITPPDAEEFSHFQQRVWQVTDDLVDQHAYDSIAIVAHLGVLRLIYQRLIDRHAIFWDLDFPQGTVTCFDNSHSREWQTSTLNGKEES